MTNLPHIAAAYALAVVLGGYFAAAAWLRLRRARRRLAGLEPRDRP
jgi:hypothetical protein